MASRTYVYDVYCNDYVAGTFTSLNDANKCARRKLYSIGFHPNKLMEDNYLRTDCETGCLYMVEPVRDVQVIVQQRIAVRPNEAPHENSNIAPTGLGGGKRSRHGSSDTMDSETGYAKRPRVNIGVLRVGPPMQRNMRITKRAFYRLIVARKDNKEKIVDEVFFRRASAVDFLARRYDFWFPSETSQIEFIASSGRTLLVDLDKVSYDVIERFDREARGSGVEVVQRIYPRDGISGKSEDEEEQRCQEKATYRASTALGGASRPRKRFREIPNGAQVVVLD